MDFLRFLITKKFLRHLGLAVAIAIILLLGTLLWLKIYTHHGKTITVPDSDWPYRRRSGRCNLFEATAL